MNRNRPELLSEYNSNKIPIGGGFARWLPEPVPIFIVLHGVFFT